jgi:hypothetical protein
VADPRASLFQLLDDTCPLQDDFPALRDEPTTYIAFVTPHLAEEEVLLDRDLDDPDYEPRYPVDADGVRRAWPDHLDLAAMVRVAVYAVPDALISPDARATLADADGAWLTSVDQIEADLNRRKAAARRVAGWFGRLYEPVDEQWDDPNDYLYYQCEHNPLSYDGHRRGGAPSALVTITMSADVDDCD